MIEEKIKHYLVTIPVINFRTYTIRKGKSNQHLVTQAYKRSLTAMGAERLSGHLSPGAIEELFKGCQIKSCVVNTNREVENYGSRLQHAYIPRYLSQEVETTGRDFEPLKK